MSFLNSHTEVLKEPRLTSVIRASSVISLASESYGVTCLVGKARGDLSQREPGADLAEET